MSHSFSIPILPWPGLKQLKKCTPPPPSFRSMVLPHECWPCWMHLWPHVVFTRHKLSSPVAVYRRCALGKRGPWLAWITLGQSKHSFVNHLVSAWLVQAVARSVQLAIGHVLGNNQLGMYTIAFLGWRSRLHTFYIKAKERRPKSTVLI